MFAVTFDIDWAPDWCIANCVSICSAAGVPMTFFVTHPSPILDELADNPLVELGIHPNFFDGSSHGRTPREVLDYSFDLVPDAVSMRTHGLFQSTYLLEMISGYEQIQTDVSLYLPFHPNLEASVLHFGQHSRRLVRLPYLWEDDLMSYRDDWNWQPWDFEDGLKIFDFHPMHIGMNACSMDNYTLLKERLGPRSLNTTKLEEVADITNTGEGARTFLESLVSAVSSDRFHTISQISERATVR